MLAEHGVYLLPMLVKALFLGKKTALGVEDKLLGVEDRFRGGAFWVGDRFLGGGRLSGWRTAFWVEDGFLGGGPLSGWRTAFWVEDRFLGGGPL